MIGPYGETAGQYLIRRRESRSVSLEEISYNTRMSIDYLEALERDDFQFFPQREYIDGFFRSYARYVGLNPEEVLKRYRIQIEMAQMEGAFQQIPLFQFPEPRAESQEPIRRVSVKLPFGGLKKILAYRRILWQIGIVIGAIAFSLYLMRQTLHKNNLPTKPPPAKATVSSKTYAHPSPQKTSAQSPRGEFPSEAFRIHY